MNILTIKTSGKTSSLIRNLLMPVFAAVFFIGCEDKNDGNGAGATGAGRNSPVAVTKVADKPPANGPGTFTFINRGDLITLDLNQMSYLQDFRITYGIREGLYTFDVRNISPIPSLAIETKISDDKKTWTFKLRPDAKWSNGDPLVAGDFVFSWLLLLESPGEYTSLLYYIKNAQAYEKSYREQDGKVKPEDVGVRAIDDQTVEISLNNPVPFLPDLMAFPTFYPRHARSMEPFKSADTKGRVNYDAKYTKPENVVTNGPFVLSEWIAGRQIVLTACTNYWDAANVKSKKVIMVVNNDPQSAFQQYEQGTVDWLADVSADVSAELKSINRSDLRATPAYGTAFLTFNTAPTVESKLGAGVKNPLSDVRVRRALAMTVEKQYIVEQITRMGEKVANSYIPPGFFKGFTSTPTPGYDVEGARKLLAEAGYAGGKGFPKLTFAYNSDNATRKAFAEFLSQGWRENLGITVDLEPLELKTYRTRVTDKNYTIGAVAWYGDYMDLSTWTDKYLSTSQNNDTNWAPPEYDALLKQAEQESDEQKRSDLLQQAEAMINTELPILPLYHYVNVTLYRDNVDGITPNAKLIVLPKFVSVK